MNGYDDPKKEAKRLEHIRDSMEKKCSELERQLSPDKLFWFGYIGVSVNFVFFASVRAKSRHDDMKTRLINLLGHSGLDRTCPIDSIGSVGGA
jgi:hypothetical protein